jgi:hypothetical protein
VASDSQLNKSKELNKELSKVYSQSKKRTPGLDEPKRYSQQMKENDYAKSP